MKHAFERRAETEKVVVGSFYDGNHRYYDENNEETVIKIFSGGCYVTNKKREVIVTILGSCISACMRDPLTGIGGMNHFLLPEGDGTGQGMRFGSFAMEQLINELMKLGANKSRLQLKLFGGGNVLKNMTDIGAKNIKFVHEFLASEGLPIAAEDMGGPFPRRIHYYPDTGKVRMRKLQRKEDMAVADEEKTYFTSISKKPVEGDIELFG